MTPTQLKEAAQVMLAAAEGKQVQCMCRKNDDRWDDMNHPCWNWQLYLYRIKPEPREWWLDLRTGRFIVFQESIFHEDAIKVREVI